MDRIQRARRLVAVAARLHQLVRQLERERAERRLRVPSRRRQLERTRLLDFARVRVRAAAHTSPDAVAYNAPDVAAAKTNAHVAYHAVTHDAMADDRATGAGD